MIEFGSDVADLKEKFSIFLDDVIEFLEHSVEIVYHAVSLSQEINEIR